MNAIVELARRHRAPLFLGLLLLAGAIIAQAAAESNPQPQSGPVLSSRDAGPRGALALALWLQRLGYRVERAEGRQSSPDDASGLYFVLAPTHQVSTTDAQLTVAWVRHGGTLVYVPSWLPVITASGVHMDDGLSGALDVGLRVGQAPGSAPAQPASPTFPYFVAPPASRFTVHDEAALRLDSDAWVPIIKRGTSQSAAIVAAERELGRGRVIAVASASFFANASIGETDNAALVLNAVVRTPASGAVTFDEYHHGVLATPDLASAVRDSPWGWALLYGSLMAFAFALWGGRRFGPAVALPREPGRSAGDYVTAFAGLLQREARRRGTIDWVQRRYAMHVRRQLARAFGVRADLPAPELAQVIAERRTVDRAALDEQLAALDRPGLGERGLLTHMRTLEPLLRSLLDRQG